ncbi:MAG: hypothetical protein ACREB8_15350 [Pseudolabrys sp.]
MTALSAAEQREIVRLLADAFDRDPLFSFVYPNAAARCRSLYLLFAAAVKDAIRFGQLDVAYRDRIVGAGINYPPGRYPLSFARNLRCLPEYSRMLAAGPFGFLQLYRSQIGLNKVRPTRPHSYGSHLGGRPGELAGSALMNYWLNDADENGWPCYLETHNQRLTRLYRPMGFEILHDGFEMFPGGPLTWTMWREPRAIERFAPCLRDLDEARLK